MDVLRSFRRPAMLPLAGVFLLGLFLGSCQSIQTVSNQQLIRHQALIDFSGLRPPEVDEPLKVRWATPRQWEPLPLQRTTLYSHRQWQSPSQTTGVGVVHVRMPLPLGAATVVSIARRQYIRNDADGRLIDQWTDDLGRHWFEVENSQYRARGYVVTRGFDAWVIYLGYRRTAPPNPGDLNLAARSMETILPQ